MIAPQSKSPQGGCPTTIEFAVSWSWYYFKKSLQEKPNTPSPLTGEGWGEGENEVFSIDYIPLPSIPLDPLSEV
jgi:hypothetical protein